MTTDIVDISTLVARLFEILDFHGDLPVFIYNDEYGCDTEFDMDEVKVVSANEEYGIKYPKRVSLGRHE